ncbi:MAG: tape measure protein, partial [Acinetobacter sp.]|uniref:tape measure protein n=1 Tax=Acinetobacter sp. TaxID=472 RepID=UPI0028367EB7
MATNSLDFLLNLKANTTGFDQGINGAKFAVNALVGAMATLGVGLGVKELAEAADSYATLSARIRLATKDTGDFKSAIAGVHQIALITNSSLDSTAELFTKLNTVAKDMGMSQQQALDLTKTV